MAQRRQPECWFRPATARQWQRQRRYSWRHRTCARACRTMRPRKRGGTGAKPEWSRITWSGFTRSLRCSLRHEWEYRETRNQESELVHFSTVTPVLNMADPKRERKRGVNGKILALSVVIRENG